MSSTKACNGCEEEKPLTEYYRCKTGKDGFRGTCKSCTKKWQVSYNQKNPGAHVARVRKWQKRNPSKVNASNARRRAKRLQARPAWSFSEWELFAQEEMYAISSLRSALTGIAHEVDHIVPLNSEVVCGLHCIDNLRVITAAENLAKSNSWAL